jgi:hypothetical protein
VGRFVGKNSGAATIFGYWFRTTALSLVACRSMGTLRFLAAVTDSRTGLARHLAAETGFGSAVAFQRCWQPL